jgi:transcription elongation factor Elf1
MGRRRKQVIKIVRRSLPELYLCPKCGKNTVKATISKTKNRATVICSSCGLKSGFEATSSMIAVDAYCSFVDHYYSMGREGKPTVD